MIKIKNNQGFTLVELMVAIAIVAILATVGFNLYQSTQASARDAKRRADVDAMSMALETRYDAVSGQYPESLLDAWFSDKKTPTDPLNTGDYIYADEALETDSYSLCARLERGGGNFDDSTATTPNATGTGNYYCKRSQQSEIAPTSTPTPTP